jgi:NADH-quinone oxidoreductase subunit N
MFAGNLMAVAQSSVKRMLAYSSIAHAGYILVALAAAAAAPSDDAALAIAAVLYYLAVYALMKLGAFLLLSQLGGEAERHLDLEDFYGLASRRPIAAACFSLFLLSLLGLPITAGFLGKFYIFDAALASHLIWLAVFLAINSVIGAYYYLRVIVAMYMREPNRTFSAVRTSWALTIVLLIAAAGTFYLGLFPGRVMAFAAHAATSLPLH